MRPIREEAPFQIKGGSSRIRNIHSTPLTASDVSKHFKDLRDGFIPRLSGHATAKDSPGLDLNFDAHYSRAMKHPHSKVGNDSAIAAARYYIRSPVTCSDSDMLEESIEEVFKAFAWRK